MTFLFSLTLFVSAALLFSVQPMIGKLILPILGGTPAVWNTCMVFFQATLLLGYAYTHFLTRWLGKRLQIIVHLGLMLSPFMVLPIQFSNKSIASIPNVDNPSPWLIGILFLAVGLPFLAVSSSAPLLQKWFSTTRHRHADDPYFLYSASNMGSMIGLLSYPILVEPTLSLLRQNWLWAVGYGCLVVLFACCALFLWDFGTVEVKIEEGYSPLFSIDQGVNGDKIPLCGETAACSQSGMAALTLRRMLKWVFFAFIPSSMMLGVTNYLSIDISPFPLLWVVPLALYLLTFILVFARRPVLPRPWMGRMLCMFSVVLLIAFFVETYLSSWLMAILCLSAFFLAAMIFHGELAKNRPGPRCLTEYYLCMSIGGVLGGLFNSMAAPLLFKDVMELPVVILLACAFRPSVNGTGNEQAGKVGLWQDAACAAGIGLLTLGLIFTVNSIELVQEKYENLLIFVLPAFLAYRYVQKPLRFGLSLAAILAVGLLLHMNPYGRTLMAERNFFGVLRVTVDAEGKYHQLFHGNTMHGKQSIDPARLRVPLSYYHHDGPIGQVFDVFNASSCGPSKVGVIGLGTGSLAAYAKPVQDWTFYEINPVVEQIARNPNFFTSLQCSRARTIKIILGDARIRLKNAPNQIYNLFIVDAFSSDSIPMHLITREALQLYLEKLSNNAILVFHISNRRLELKSVFANLAHDAGLAALIRDDSWTSPADNKKGKDGSVWVVMARHKENIVTLTMDPRWKPLNPDLRTAVWTDDFSNILSVIKWR